MRKYGKENFKYTILEIIAL